MSVSYKGATDVNVADYSFRQDDGLHFTRTYRGIPTTILGKANSFKNAGYDTYVFHDGPYSNLTATRTTSWNQRPYVELWSVTKELVEKSLFSLPGAMQEAGTFSADLGGNAGYKKEIEDAVAARLALDPAMFAGYDTAELIWEELMRGVQAYEHEYTVLSRTVNFAFDTPAAGTLKILSNQHIMSTANLAAWYNPPSNIMVELPADQGTSDTPQRMWGWRIRDQNAEVTNATTGQHQISWVYAQWSTFLYTEATSIPDA